MAVNFHTPPLASDKDLQFLTQSKTAFQLPYLRTTGCKNLLNNMPFLDKGAYCIARADQCALVTASRPQDAALSQVGLPSEPYQLEDNTTVYWNGTDALIFSVNVLAMSLSDGDNIISGQQIKRPGNAYFSVLGRYLCHNIGSYSLRLARVLETPFTSSAQIFRNNLPQGKFKAIGADLSINNISNDDFTTSYSSNTIRVKSSNFCMAYWAYENYTDGQFYNPDDILPYILQKYPFPKPGDYPSVGYSGYIYNMPSDNKLLQAYAFSDNRFRVKYIIITMTQPTNQSYVYFYEAA